MDLPMSPTVCHPVSPASPRLPSCLLSPLLSATPLPVSLSLCLVLSPPCLSLPVRCDNLSARTRLLTERVIALGQLKGHEVFSPGKLLLPLQIGLMIQRHGLLHGGGLILSCNGVLGMYCASATPLLCAPVHCPCRGDAESGRGVLV